MIRYVPPFLCSLILLTGCSLISPTQEVSIRTPSVPEELEALFRGIWTLEFCSISGDSNFRELNWEEGVPDSFTLSRRKEEDLLILLSSPFSTPGQGFYPAGLWLPWNREGGTANFHNGAAVSLISMLVQSGVSMEDFNMPRFLEEMAGLDNPWNCDQNLLLRQLGRHEMTTWYIHEKRTFSVELTLPEGCWYRANPDAPPLWSDGTAMEAALSEGYHFFYSPSRKETAELQVDDHGEAVVLFSSSQGISGSCHSTGDCPVDSR